MTKINTGEAIVECLRLEGVRYAFGIIGSSYLEILDALHDPEDIEFVSVRHEQAAVHIADAYARMTGGIGVCLAQGGPGVTNLVTGLALAKHACSPVVAIGGAAMTQHDQRDAFQEVDQLSLMRPVCKAVLRIGRADRAAEIMRQAFRTALAGRRGPVFVEVPRDLLSQQVEFSRLMPSTYRARMPPTPASEEVAKVLDILRSAKRPLVIAGSGVKWERGSKELIALVEALTIPFVTSNSNRDLAPNDHPLFFGQLGPRGSSLARDVAQRADVILALGTRLGFTTAFFNYNYVNASARIIQCDIDQSEIGRLYPVDLGIVGDATSLARSLREKASERPNAVSTSEWVDWGKSKRADWLSAREAAIDGPVQPIRTPRFFAELRRAVPRNVNVVTDAGYWGNNATDAFDHYECPSLITPQEFGCLGFSFPAALGVQFAKPRAPVVCINGDGGFAMNMQELETAVRCGLNPLILVPNNFSWGVEKSYQKDFYEKRYVGANIGNPRFDKLAESFGARGFRVEYADQIGDIVRDAFQSDVPTVVDVIVDRDEISGLRKDAVVPRKSGN